mgnify:CR=1 FL=1
MPKTLAPFVLMLLVGCSVGPAYVAPHFDTHPNALRDNLILGQPAAQDTVITADGFGGSGIRVEAHPADEFPGEDPATYAMLCRGDSVGTFQVESRAQMSMLPRLQPRSFYDLVIEVAIVRPGPIQGGMVHPYLRRRQGLEPVEFPQEALREALGRTLGVPIFQEQVMQIAMLAANFTPGEADQLRRAMAAWGKDGSLMPMRQRLLDGMKRNGYEDAFAESIFEMIKGFGSYGFPESHSASFALLAYVSSWIKCHHPAAFFAALVNSQPMGFYAPAQLIREARRAGVEVRPVDVINSDWDCTVVRSRDGAAAIRLGLRLIAGLDEAVAERLIAARKHTPFADVEDLVQRAALDERLLGFVHRVERADLCSLASGFHFHEEQQFSVARDDVHLAAVSRLEVPGENAAAMGAEEIRCDVFPV